MFCGDHVVHTTHDEPGSAGVETRWTSGEKIGAGGFGIVLRHQDDKGQLRAVKKLYRHILTAKKIDVSRELGTLAKLKSVGTIYLGTDTQS